MSELVADCPRCKAAQITFDILAATKTRTEWNWQQWYEAYCCCRQCRRGTIFQVAQREPRVLPPQGLVATKGVSMNNFVTIEGYVSLKDVASVAPPEHLPPDINAAFKEGATCLAVNCYNAAAAMFRLCVDIATQSMLPATDDDGPNAKIRRSLGLRLDWLFENGRLPAELHNLSTCIKEDGNDGAHEGSLSKEDAEDLLDFTEALLERLYTEPERLRLAELRRQERRGGKT